MHNLTEDGRTYLANLFGQIIQQNPPLKQLNLSQFTGGGYCTGELILQSLLNSSINSIVDLNLSGNRALFMDGRRGASNLNKLIEIINKQSEPGI